MDKVVRYSSSYRFPSKIKEGINESYYRGEGLFGRLSYNIKPDIISPYLHYIDESNLKGIVQSYILTPQNLQSMYNNLASTRANRASYGEFEKKVKELYGRFSNSGVPSDVFKLYYNKMKDLEFEERTEKNKGKFTVVEKSNDPISKIMTEKSNLKSSIFARNIINYLLCKMAFKLINEPDEDPGNQKGQDQQNQKFDDLLDQIMGGSGGQGKDPLLEQMKQQARDQCLKMDNVLSEEQQEHIFDNFKDMSNLINNAAGSGDIVNVMQEYLARINLSLGTLKETIKKLLDKSVSYFSAQKKTIYENIMDSDNIGGLDDFINLHPKLRKFMIEDVMIPDVEKIGKISVYIDVSGSMSSTCGVTDKNGKHVSRLDFCKALTAKLMSMNLLNKIYLFDDRVRELKPDIFSLAVVATGGGTSINNVMRHLMSRKDNALIITDAEDSCSFYDEKAFFIGTLGCNFDGFDHIEQYSEKQQVVEFDGKRIRKINADGVPI